MYTALLCGFISIKEVWINVDSLYITLNNWEEPGDKARVSQVVSKNYFLCDLEYLCMPGCCWLTCIIVQYLRHRAISQKHTVVVDVGDHKLFQKCT